ncbi:hypothetical protein ACOME3_001508 [Neoechinorhynchus agilis]
MIKWTMEALGQHPLRKEQYDHDALDDIKPGDFNSKTTAHSEYKEVEPSKKRMFLDPGFKSKIRSETFVRIVEQMHQEFTKEGNEVEKMAAIDKTSKKKEELFKRIKARTKIKRNDLSSSKTAKSMCCTEGCKRVNVPFLSYCPDHMECNKKRQPFSASICVEAMEQLMISLGIKEKFDALNLD